MPDAVVVGGGPAGLSAATWLARHRIDVVIYDSGEYRNWCVEQAHGYLGCDPVNPGELLERARAELAAYGCAELRRGKVDVALADGDGFLLTVDGVRVHTRRLVLATGVRDQFPEVANFFEHYGASAFHCPTCDGYEARDKQVVVFGWSPAVVEFALKLQGWAASVTVVTDGRQFEAEAGERALLNGVGVHIRQDNAVELVGQRERLEGVRLEGGELVPCDMVFFTIGHDIQAGLAAQLGCGRTDEGCIEIDDAGQTSVAGVYAAGDVTPGLQLIQVAAAQGAVAGVACALSLWREDGAAALLAGRADQPSRGYDMGMTEATAPDPERIERVEQQIDEAKRGLEDLELDEESPRFIEKGDLPDQPVDDTIAPG